VVTGQERGIVSSMSYEAKALGITRAMRMGEIRKRFPEVTVLSSDYDTYTLYAKRMYDIVRRYSPIVEEYSIDECFADVTGLAEEKAISQYDLAKMIKDDLETSLGLSFSVGVSTSKVMAKIASKWNKPSGITMITRESISEYISNLPIGRVWGIGRSHAIDMRKKGIVTALDLASKDRSWAVENFPKPIQEIYEELNGGIVNEVNIGDHGAHSSVQRTRTFRPSSSDKEFIFSELSNNIEDACSKLRRHGQFASHASFFIKSQEFSYHGGEAVLPQATNVPQDIIEAIKRAFDSTFEPRGVYRATGVRLFGLSTSNTSTGQLFGGNIRTDNLSEMYKVMDVVGHKYGKEVVFLGSSLRSMKSRGEEKGGGSGVKKNFFRKKFAMPFLGQVR
jgi:DNA polymerase IV